MAEVELARGGDAERVVIQAVPVRELDFATGQDHRHPGFESAAELSHVCEARFACGALTSQRATHAGGEFLHVHHRVLGPPLQRRERGVGQPVARRFGPV